MEDFNFMPTTDELPAKAKHAKRQAMKIDESKFDPRMDEVLFRPGGEVDWNIDVGVAQKIPAAFKFKLRDLSKQRNAGGTSSSAAAARFRKDTFEFLYDSGTDMTHVPDYMSNLLDDVRPVEPFMLETAAGNHVAIREIGTLRFKVKGVQEVLELPCLVNPASDLLLLCLDDFERLDRGRIQSRFWNNDVVFKGTSVPIIRRGKSPYLRLHVLSGDGLVPRRCADGTSARFPGRRAASTLYKGSDPYDYVHRICGHANPDCCRRTAKRAAGLPSLHRSAVPDRPCPECSLGKLKAPSRGHGNLGNGLQADRPGKVICGDTFGPVAIPGLAGERYFIALVDEYTGWGVVRALTSLTEVPLKMKEMINEIHSTLGTTPGSVDLTLHTDNASYFTSGQMAKDMGNMGVTMHFASPYDPRTNPFAERYGGILLPTIRALLLEGSYPPKFWSVLLRTACWTLNRLVRPHGKAPIEEFAGQDVDFSKVHPTGILCYWSIDKKHRDDPKFGNAASVGVYIGPGEAVGSRGHLVYTADNKLRVVSHVIVDHTSKPFQIGLITEMLSRSKRVTSVFDRASVDPSVFVLPSGESALSYIGARVRNTFGGQMYRGRVHRVIPPEEDEGDRELWFQVIYEDGDVEDYSFEELSEILTDRAGSSSASKSAASFLADVDDDDDAAEQPLEGTGLPISQVLTEYQAIVEQAARNVAAAASRREAPPGKETHRRAASASKAEALNAMPFGETYNWSKVFKMKGAERQRHFDAMQAEIDKLTDANHARWQHLPPGEIAIPSVGVFRIKAHDLHHGGYTLKVRFCANGQAAEEPLGGWDRTANVASCSQILTV
ncbi:MAG: hypothetical protein ACO3P1_11075, partial [Pseudomonadales bacterium]